MTIAATHLETGVDATSKTSYSTGSVAPASNNLLLLFIEARNALAAPVDPTVTGNGLTWVKVDKFRFDAASSYRDMWLYRALGASPSAGAITINFGSDTHSTLAWSVSEFSGVDTSGTNGSGAVVQFAHTTATTTNNGSTATLAAFASANNATYGGCAVSGTTVTAFTAGSGFTKLGEVTNSNNSVMVQWRSDNSTSVGFTFSGGATETGVIAIEIAAASGGASYTQAVSGIFPEASGNPVKGIARILAGDSPAPSGTAASVGSFGQLASGGFPAPSGSIAKQTAKLLEGDLPSATGAPVKSTSRALAGDFPPPYGDPGASAGFHQAVTGVMGAIAGAVATVLNPAVTATRRALGVIGSAFRRIIGG